MINLDAILDSMAQSNNTPDASSYSTAQLGSTSDFIQAVASNNQAAAEILFNEDEADVNEARPVDGMTALMLAAREGNLEMVKWLLSIEARVNVATTTNYETPLIMAAQGSHHEIAQLLLEADSSNINAKSRTNKSAITIAARNMDERMIEILLDKKADIPTDDAEILELIELSKKKTILIEDLKNLYAKGITFTKKFLENPLIINKLDRHSTAFATLLLSDKILVNKIIASFNRKNPEAKINGNDFLVALSAIEDPKKPHNALARRVFAMAVRKGDHVIMKNLLTREIDPNIACYNTNKYKTLNALMHAAMSGDLAMTRLLYQYKADANFVCEGINPPLSPLDFAVKKKHQDVAFFIAVKEGDEKFVCESLIDFAIAGGSDEKILRLLDDDEIQANLTLREVSLLSLILPDEESRDMIIANYNSRNPDSSINEYNTRETIDIVISNNDGEKLDAIINVIFNEAKDRCDFIVINHLAERGFIAAQNYAKDSIIRVNPRLTVPSFDTSYVMVDNVVDTDVLSILDNKESPIASPTNPYADETFTHRDSKKPRYQE